MIRQNNNNLEVSLPSLHRSDRSNDPDPMFRIAMNILVFIALAIVDMWLRTITNDCLSMQRKFSHS